jgi:hypothetical protein
MLRPLSATDQPVTARAPLNTGRADGAARHTTWCPLVPESAEVKRSGADSRYTPPASSTTMSSDMLSLSDRTAVCAPDSEHGLVAAQAVPVPVGEAYRVVTAAAAGAGPTMATAATAASAAVTAAARRDGADLRAVANEDANTGSPHLGKDPANASAEASTSIALEPGASWWGAADISSSYE